MTRDEIDRILTPAIINMGYEHDRLGKGDEEVFIRLNIAIMFAQTFGIISYLESTGSQFSVMKPTPALEHQKLLLLASSKANELKSYKDSPYFDVLIKAFYIKHGLTQEE